MGRLIGILLVVWLVIGGIAAFQRGYFEDTRTNLLRAGDIALTVVAGPLNYFGVNPKGRRRASRRQTSRSRAA